MSDFLAAISQHLNRTPTMCACGHPSVLHADGTYCLGTTDDDDICPCDRAPADPHAEDGAGLTVNEVQPPHCFICDRPLVSRTELNRRIDWQTDVCDPCAEGPEDDDCWCSYGFYRSGDPRQFQPDEENPDPEIAAWRELCEAWDRGEQAQPSPEEHGPWIDPETGAVTIGARPSPGAVGTCSAIRSLGMGATYCQQHRQSADAWKSWPLRMVDLVGGLPLDDADGPAAAMLASHPYEVVERFRGGFGEDICCDFCSQVKTHPRHQQADRHAAGADGAGSEG